MKTKWTIFIVAAAIGFSGFAANLYLGIRNAGRETETIATTSANAIFSNWDDEELFARGSPNFIRSSDRNKIDAFFTKLSSLGHLKKLEKLKGGLVYKISLGASNIATARYTGGANFEHGNINFEIVLIKYKDWKIDTFRIVLP